MIDFDKMSPEEAKEYLVKQKTLNKQRQRKYLERMQRKGQKRINTFISRNAAEILKSKQAESGRTVGEIISDALSIMAKYDTKSYDVLSNVLSDKTSKTTANKHKQNTNVVLTKHKISDDVNKKYTATLNKIVELSAQGLGFSEIAEQLEKAGYQTARGKTKWHRTTIRRIVNRLK